MDAAPTSPRRFDADLRPVAALLAGVVLTSLVVLSAGRALAPRVSLPEGLFGFLVTVVGSTLTLAVALAALRWEGVRPTALGLGFGRRRAAVAVALVAGLWLAINATAAGLLAATGAAVSTDVPHGLSPVQFGFFVVEQLLVVGLVEEFVWRGYLQTKLRDGAAARGLADGPARATGVLAAASLFALWHVPQRLLVQGATPGGTAGSVLLLAALGVGFGLLYEATDSVLLVGLLHGTWNVRPFVVPARSAAPGPVEPLAVLVVPLAATLVVVAAYRRWGLVDRGTTHGATR
jgi:hypothetical protein